MRCNGDTDCQFQAALDTAFKHHDQEDQKRALALFKRLFKLERMMREALNVVAYRLTELEKSSKSMEPCVQKIPELERRVDLTIQKHNDLMADQERMARMGKIMTGLDPL